MNTHQSSTIHINDRTKKYGTVNSLILTRKPRRHVGILKYRRTSIVRGGRNRIGRREKWPKKSWEEGEIGGKSREEGEKET